MFNSEHHETNREGTVTVLNSGSDFTLSTGNFVDTTSLVDSEASVATILRLAITDILVSKVRITSAWEGLLWYWLLCCWSWWCTFLESSELTAAQMFVVVPDLILTFHEDARVSGLWAGADWWNLREFFSTVENIAAFVVEVSSRLIEESTGFASIHIEWNGSEVDEVWHIVCVFNLNYNN